jgi:hypothetical protein
MANLMITTHCNFTCRYCFGRDMIGPGHTKTHMSWETFISLLDWIDRSGMDQLSIHLMGGEPTLNPLFFDMLDELVRRKRDVLIFSNAATRIDPHRLQEAVRKGIRWVVNCNHPSEYKGNQLDFLKANLTILGKNACVTFNVTGGQFDYGYVFDYIKTYGMDPRIKVGVALPTLQRHNVFAQWHEFPAIAERIMELHEAVTAIGCSIDFECGVPYCLFSAEQHRKLDKVRVSHCNSRLDITPWGEVINCLPLSKMTTVQYDHFSDYGQARNWFEKLLTPYRQVGSTADCLTCESHLNQDCRACHAYGIAEFNRVPLPPLPKRGEQTGCTC